MVGLNAGDAIPLNRLALIDPEAPRLVPLLILQYKQGRLLGEGDEDTGDLDGRGNTYPGSRPFRGGLTPYGLREDEQGHRAECEPMERPIDHDMASPRVRRDAIDAPSFHSEKAFAALIVKHHRRIVPSAGSTAYQFPAMEER